MKVILSGLREEWSEFNLKTIVLKNRDWRRLKWKGEESLVPFAMRAALCNYSFPHHYDATKVTWGKLLFFPRPLLTNRWQLDSKMIMTFGVLGKREVDTHSTGVLIKH